MSTPLEQQQQYQQQQQYAQQANGVRRVDPVALMALAVRALSGHALKWVGLALAFALFGWIVVEPQPAWAKLVAAGSFGVMVLVLWVKKGER